MRCSSALAGAIIPSTLRSAPNTKTAASAARSQRCASLPMPDRRRGRQLGAGAARDEGDIVVRARVDAVQAEGAVHISGFERLEEGELAAALRQAAAGSGVLRRP